MRPMHSKKPLTILGSSARFSSKMNCSTRRRIARQLIAAKPRADSRAILAILFMLLTSLSAGYLPSNATSNRNMFSLATNSRCFSKHLRAISASPCFANTRNTRTGNRIFRMPPIAVPLASFETIAPVPSDTTMLGPRISYPPSRVMAGLLLRAPKRDP